MHTDSTAGSVWRGALRVRRVRGGPPSSTSSRRHCRCGHQRPEFDTHKEKRTTLARTLQTAATQCASCAHPHSFQQQPELFPSNLIYFSKNKGVNKNKKSKTKTFNQLPSLQQCSRIPQLTRAEISSTLMILLLRANNINGSVLICWSN